MKRSDREYGTRGRAVRLHRAGVPFSEICRRLRRSRGWLSKWLHRFRSSRWAGLRTQSRRPRRIPRRSSRAVVERIVGLRAELEAHRTRRTRYPGAWLLRHHALLHGVPREFDLAAYRDARGRLHLPVARGQVSWIQKVDPEGFIAINARPYSIGKRRTGEYVQATLFTHRRRVVVYSARHRRIRSFPFVITEPIVAPLR